MIRHPPLPGRVDLRDTTARPAALISGFNLTDVIIEGAGDGRAGFSLAWKRGKGGFLKWG